MDDLLTRFAAHIATHRLMERAEDGFRAWIAGASANLLSDWTRDELHVQLDSIHLCIRPAHVDYPYIDTKLHILRGNDWVGHYRLITRIDGTAADDYFVLMPAHQ